MAWTDEQLKAINEHGKNIIVSAGAGSGKTAVLTARTIRILKENIHINELLILTFTKAAAEEMKNRIRKNIKKEIENYPSLKEELNLIDQAYITTFDSFALSLVKKYHYLLNISNNISICDSSIIEIIKNKLINETFDEFYLSPNDDFKNLIYSFCVKDDNELKKLILQIASKIDGFPNREEYLKNYEINYLSDDYISKLIIDYGKILIEKLDEIKNQINDISSLCDNTYLEKIYNSLNGLLDSQTYEEIYLKINTIKLPSLPKNSEDDLKNSKELLKKKLDELKDICNTYGPLKEIRENLINSFNNTKTIINIITKYLDKLHFYKEQNEIYDFQDIALLSIKILRENEEVRNSIKYSFKQIMIDEYQDTNDIQETFIKMIENDNVYMVGDIKQSIYRFRNANPYIFKSKYDEYSNNIDGIKIDLVKNFRSRREVLTNINKIFNYVMDDEIGGADYQKSHQMVYGNTSYIEEGKTNYDYNMSFLTYDINDDYKNYSKREIEAFIIGKDIKNKIKQKFKIFDKDKKELRPITYQDFVILMDRATDFEIYKKIFEYLEIPLNLYKDENMNESNDIYIIKNIIDLIIKISNNIFDPEFKYDYISIARSYLYRLDDAIIFETFKKDDFTHTEIYNTFKEISLKLNYSSITEIISNIIEKTNIYEKLITVGNIESSTTRITKIIELAENLEKLGYDIYMFNDYLKSLIENDIDIKYNFTENKSDSVKIMTIHKSKGLEYHICYYSGLYKLFNISDLNQRFLIDNNYGIICPYFKEGIGETITKYLVKQNYLKEEISEKIRLFYVALTRAKEQMIFVLPEETTNNKHHLKVISKNERMTYRSFSSIINSLKANLTGFFKLVDLDDLQLSKEYLYNKDRELLLNKNDIEEFKTKEISLNEEEVLSEEHYSKQIKDLIDSNTYHNLKTGLEIHDTLEYIDFQNPNYDLITNKFIKNKVKSFLNNPLLKNIKDYNIYKEYEFIYEKDNQKYHGIIDLLLENKNEIIIIDYKLKNIIDENYLKQLNGYKEYLKNITHKDINIYLYSIIEEQLKKL